MISKTEVERIAKLARLELTGEEIEKMQRDLSKILDYFDVLKKAPEVRDASKKIEAENIVRKDKIVERPASLAQVLVNAAPESKDRYIKVKQILG